MSRSHRSWFWLLAASVAALAAVVLLGRALVVPEPPAAAERSPGERLAVEPGDGTSPLPAHRSGEASPVAGAEASSSEPAGPPPLGSLGDGSDDDPPIEPEQPQTPEWRLEKTGRLVTLLRERIGRLETRAAEAARSGDDAAATEARILLQRSRHRLEALQADVAVLRRELRADAAGPGGPR